MFLKKHINNILYNQIIWKFHSYLYMIEAFVSVRSSDLNLTREQIAYNSLAILCASLFLWGIGHRIINHMNHRSNLNQIHAI